jgi:histidinol-phosphate aminotransferase
MTDSLSNRVRPPLRGGVAYSVPKPEGIHAKLDANELAYALPVELTVELGRELATVELNRYPDAEAAPLRQLIAADLAVPPQSLSFGNGSDEIIHLLCSAFADDGGASVLYPTPSFSVFRVAAHAAGSEPVEVPLTEDLLLDPLALDAAAAASNPAIAFFARPNNPTGTLWSRQHILDFAANHPSTLVVSDEAYIDYGGDSLIDACGAVENLAIMRTLSKVGLAALRIGYLHARPAVIAAVESIRPPYNLGSLNQHAAVWMLTHQRELMNAWTAEVRSERGRIAAKLSSYPDIHVFESSANLIMFRVGTAGDNQADALWHSLVDRGVLIRNFDKPGPLSGCLRVTIGSPAENDLFLSAFAELRAA